MLSLDVAISTHGENGILKVEKMIPREKEGVRYIVSWQNYENGTIPETLQARKDVEIYKLDKKGLSNNRNNAIDHCRSDIVLIADDDLEYQEGFETIILDEFKKRSSMDLAVFKVNFLREKKYPSSDCCLKLPYPKNFYVTSMEIAFRRKSIGNLRFFPELGLGSEKMFAGEEEFFLFSAIKRGLNCFFINKYICSHPTETTGDKSSEGILMGMGFVISLIYPWSAGLRILLKGWRVSKKGKMSFPAALKALIRGAWRRKRTFKQIPPQYRW